MEKGYGISILGGGKALTIGILCFALFIGCAFLSDQRGDRKESQEERVQGAETGVEKTADSDICRTDYDKITYADKPVEVVVSGGDWLYAATVDASTGEILYTGYRAGYWERDIEYGEETEDGLGNCMVTAITLPKIGDAIPAATVINGKIREDAERFYGEQLSFHESVRERETAQGEWENLSRGSFCCHLAYAGEHYVSIVYRKEFSTQAAEYQKEYVTRLYSSETGEELQIEDLFAADWEEVSRRLSFFINRTEEAFDLFGDDLSFLENTFYRIFYCLTEEGLDVFFVEDMRTFKEWHFVIPYGNLEDELLGWSDGQKLSAVSQDEDSAEILILVSGCRPLLEKGKKCKSSDKVTQ